MTGTTIHARAEPAPSPWGGRALPRPGPARLLLADDHDLLLEAFRRLLEPEFLVLRGVTDGEALIAAALCAEGESIITPVETVERGYASVVDKLASLGAQVERVSGGRRATDEK